MWHCSSTHSIRMKWDSQSNITLTHYSLGNHWAPPRNLFIGLRHCTWYLTMGNAIFLKNVLTEGKPKLTLSLSLSLSQTHARMCVQDTWLFLTGSENGLLISKLLSIVLYFKGQIHISENWTYSCPCIKGF